MDKIQNFETYFLISKKKWLINVYDKQNFKNIFFEEKIHENICNELNLDLINEFLGNTIFRIEKLINSFIENINLIVESDEFFPIDISIKKNINGEILEQKDLIHLLNEAKQNCKNTMQDKKIIHMIIKSYTIDDKKFLFFPDKLRSNFISIDINFDCLPIHYLNKIEKIFKNYQIAIKHILNFSYLESYLDKGGDIFDIASKIIEGHNKNEVIIIPKKTYIKGFFERFFNYFS